MNAAPLICRWFVVLSLTLASWTLLPQAATAHTAAAVSPAAGAVAQPLPGPPLANFLTDYIMNDRGRMVQVATFALIIGLLILMKR